MEWVTIHLIGGMVSSTILTLLVIPMLYALWRGRSIPIGAPPLCTYTDLSLQEQNDSSVSEEPNKR